MNLLIIKTSKFFFIIIGSLACVFVCPSGTALVGYKKHSLGYINDKGIRPG